MSLKRRVRNAPWHVTRLTVYSVGVAEQYLNHTDDRARGEGNNPFGAFTDVTAVAQASGNGPFPGDQAIYQLDVYSDANLKTRIGTAVFVCIYAFSKDGYCDASFKFHGGNLVGTGSFGFTSTSFTLAINGGTGKYLGLSGVMRETPTPNHAQRLAFAFG